MKTKVSGGSILACVWTGIHTVEIRFSSIDSWQHIPHSSLPLRGTDKSARNIGQLGMCTANGSGGKRQEGWPCSRPSEFSDLVLKAHL